MLERVNAEVPADHAVRAEGWDSAVRSMNSSYMYLAPEIIGSMWIKLGGACSTYFTKYAESGEAWALRASAVLRDDDKHCFCCQSPSKEELDTMIQAHPERLIIKDSKVQDAAEALLLLSRQQPAHDVVEGAQALLNMKHSTVRAL